MTILSRSVVFLLVVASLSGCTSGEPASERAVPAPESTMVAESPETAAGICDYNPDEEAVSCVVDTLAFEDSAEGALERLRRGESWAQDLKYMLYDQETWNTLMAPTFDLAEFVPGSEMEYYGFYLNALEDIPTAFAWQQEWRLASGGVLVEQAVMVTSAEDAQKAVALWKQAALSAGLLEETFNDAPAGSFTTSFVDSSELYPERRCGSQSIVAAGPLLLSVIHLTGGDCLTGTGNLSTYALGPLAGRATAIFAG